jgi:hypothetical protein
VYRIKKLKKWPRSKRAVEPEREREREVSIVKIIIFAAYSKNNIKCEVPEQNPWLSVLKQAVSTVTTKR